MNLPDTRAARDRILGRLRDGRAAPSGASRPPDLGSYLRGPYGRGCDGERPDPRTLVDAFERAARGWRAEVLHAGAGDWPQAVWQALQQYGCVRVLAGRGCPGLTALRAAMDGQALWLFEQPLEAWKRELFEEVDAGITGAAAGIADTGTLVLRPGPDEPRSLSLVPPVHVALLRVADLYASLPAAMQALAPARDMPSNLLLVSGPSKTADIQQTLAYGAHGPKHLAIVLVHGEGTRP